MRFTRRDFFYCAAPLALSASTLILARKRGLSIISAAGAETAAAPDVNDPGPLPDRVLGLPSAPITIIEYASMTCSHCAEFARTTFPKLKTGLIDTGKVRYIAREFPLDDLAAAASMVIRSLPEERYYEVMDLLFREHGEWWSSSRIEPLMMLAVAKLGFSEDSFNACLGNRQLLDRISQARERAGKLGVTSTPTFFLNGEKLRFGYMTIDQIEEQIKANLKS